MLHQRTKWVAVAALFAAQMWWIAGGETAVAAGKADKGAADSGAATPAAPTISGVVPPSSSFNSSEVITIVGDHFRSDASAVTITYGPQGVESSCPLVAGSLTSEKRVQCTLSGSPLFGQAQKFVVTVRVSGKALQSDASTATYTPLGKAEIIAIVDDKAGSGDFRQVHLRGRNLAVAGGDPPTLTYQDPNLGVVPCTNPYLVASSELFCTLPNAITVPADKTKFNKIVRAGEPKASN